MKIHASVGVPNLNPQEYSELDPADMLSRFPDSVLSNILSFLPTKYAVATSVLSRRWEFLWTQIHSLYFDDKMPSIIQRDDQDAGRGMSFSQFVERVMLLRDSKYSMEKFHLNCCCDASRINTWISSATAAGVRDLTLSFCTGEIIQLPRRLFTSNSLVVLKLSGCQILINLQRACLPSLKTLHLCSVRYQNNTAVREFISSCLVLELFFIRRSGPDNVTEFHISSHTLKRLTAYFYSSLADRPRKSNVELKLDTPRLQFLKLWGQTNLLSAAKLKELPSIQEANIHTFERSLIGSNMRNGWWGFLSCLRNVKVLSLSNCSQFSPILSLASVGLPSFCKLTSLKLEAVFCIWERLQFLLDKADNLEALAYHENRSCGFPQHQQTMKWTIKPRLSCLSSVSIIGFHGGPCNIELVEYILQNAKVLSKMEIRCSSETTIDNKFELLQKVAEMPRVSPSCKITFS